MFASTNFEHHASRYERFCHRLQVSEYISHDHPAAAGFPFLVYEEAVTLSRKDRLLQFRPLFANLYFARRQNKQGEAL